MFSRSKRLAGGGVLLIVLAITGLVYAAWTTSGSGSGYAKAGSSQALSTVDSAASSTATLYPGATGNVTLKVSNPNSYPVRITSVTLNGTNAAITADSGHPGCVTTGVSFTDQLNQTIDVAANSTTTAVLNNAVSMSNASDNGCQGATFSIPVSLTGASNAS